MLIPVMGSAFHYGKYNSPISIFLLWRLVFCRWVGLWLIFLWFISYRLVSLRFIPHRFFFHWLISLLLISYRLILYRFITVSGIYLIRFFKGNCFCGPCRIFIPCIYSGFVNSYFVSCSSRTSRG